MSDTVRFKFKASHEASEADIVALLRMPGVCSVASGGFSARGFDSYDQVFDQVTSRDMRRASEDRWEITLDVEHDSIDEFVTTAEKLGKIKAPEEVLRAVRSRTWLGKQPAGQHFPS